MRLRTISVLLASVLSLSACDAMKEALTAHTDVVAKTEGQELSVTRLSDLLGNSPLQIEVNRDIALIVADLWKDYQMLGVAAARGDSLTNPKAIDQATLGVTSNIRLRRFMEKVAESFQADSASEATYNQAEGGLFVARHILFPVPGGASQEQKDSVRRVAEGVRGRLTSANFADLARRYSADPGSKDQGGNLGPFRRGDMVKPFGDAVASLQPGELSGLVETNFGFHLIQRPTYAAAKAQYDTVYGASSLRLAESTYVARLDDDARITIRSNAATAAKEAVRDLASHRTDDDVMATFRGGELTVGRFVIWVESYPAQYRLPQQMAQAHDTLVRHFVRSIARNEVMLKKADSAGIVLTPEERTQLESEVRSMLANLQERLGITPAMLADSARSVPERERLAAARADSFVNRVLNGQAEPISVPPPIQAMLAERYDARTYSAGLDRAVERARRLRTVADSTRAAQQPRSQVPLPSPTPPGGAGGGAGGAGAPRP